MAYPPVKVTNSTQYMAKGTAKFIACKHWDYSLSPITYDEHKRGLCLLKKISAVVSTPGGDIEATPYTSSGTSYSQFAVIQTGEHEFVVTRIVTGAKDESPPEDDGRTEEDN
ncbi:hypothetical protein ACFLSZ_03020 [Candidatus Bipolaricaulota bacterium]